MKSVTGADEAKYWYFVSGDVVDRSIVPEFNDWYNREGGHINDHLVIDGITYSWRIQETEHAANAGHTKQEFSAVYQCDRIDPFQMRWTPLRQETAEWEARRERSMANWGKTPYRMIAAVEGDGAEGGYWIREEYSTALGAVDTQALEDYVAETRLPALVSAPGAHRGWHLRAEHGNPHQTVPHWWEHVTIVEVDDPDAFLKHPQEESPAGVSRPDGLHVARVLYRMSQDDADPSFAVEWRVEPAEIS